MPLVFGVQRFGSASGAPANTSGTQAALTGGMGWANGGLGLGGGGGAAADGSGGRRLADDLAKPLFSWTMSAGRWIADASGDPDWETTARRLGELAYSTGRRLASKGSGKAEGGGDGEAEGGGDAVGGGGAGNIGADIPLCEPSNAQPSVDAGTEADGRRLASKGGGKSEGDEQTGSAGGSAGDISIQQLESGSGGNYSFICRDGTAVDLSDFGGPPPALGELVDSLMTFCIAIPVILGVQLFCIWYWRYRMNRTYYRELLLPPPIEVEENAPEFTYGRRKFCFCGPRKKKKRRRAMFIAFPGVFVFPSLLVLGITFFATGFVGTSLNGIFECRDIYPDDSSSRLACMSPFIVVLTLMGLFMCVNFSMLMHFHINFRKSSWEPLVLPSHPEDIEDPLFRWISKVRWRMCRWCKKGDSQRILVDRARGEFIRPNAAIEEPTRTERLLDKPYIIYRDNTADAIDSLKLVYMNRASGYNILGVTYDFVAISAQWLIAIANGFGPSLEIGTPAAMVQLVTVCTIQWATASYIALLQPSVDRVDALVMSTQFFCEGGMTFMLILGSMREFQDDIKEHFQTTAFVLGMVAMAAPIFEKFYDAIIVQLSKIMRKDEFSWAGCAFAMIGLILTLPGLIASIFGIEIAGDGDIEGAMDEAAGAMEAAVDDVTAGLETFGAAANVFSDLAWLNNPLPKHHKAAVKIQRFREKKMLKEKAKRHRAASRLQAAVRGRIMRRNLKEAQAAMPAALRDLHRSSSLSNARMRQLNWVDREVRKDVVQERLARARASGAQITTATRTRSFTRTRGSGMEPSAGGDLFDMRMQAAGRIPTRSVDAKLEPGKANLRDVVVEGVGVVYTRARPNGRETTDDLRDSAIRMKKRAARLSLPAGMPPRPPTISGAGAAFKDVVMQAKRKHDEGPHSPLGALSSGAHMAGDAVAGATKIADSLTFGMVGATGSVASGALGSADRLSGGVLGRAGSMMGGMMGAVGLSRNSSSQDEPSPGRSAASSARPATEEARSAASSARPGSSWLAAEEARSRGVSFGKDALPPGAPPTERDQALRLRSALARRSMPPGLPPGAEPPKRTPRTPSSVEPVAAAPAVSRAESLTQRARAAMRSTRAARDSSDHDMGV